MRVGPRRYERRGPGFGNLCGHANHSELVPACHDGIGLSSPSCASVCDNAWRRQPRQPHPMNSSSGNGPATEQPVSPYSSSANTATADSAIAASLARARHTASNAAPPTGGISKARKDGSIIATVNASIAAAAALAMSRSQQPGQQPGKQPKPLQA